jgi:hypothetical protein
LACQKNGANLAGISLISMIFNTDMKKLILIALFVPVFAFAPDELIKTRISEGITVVLPSELKPMTKDDLAQRYPSVRAPLGAFTNEDRAIDFSVNISATQWPDENLEIAKKFFRAGIYNLYDKIEIISEGIYEIHKKKFIYFEFVSRINSVKMLEGTQPAIFHYTFIQYLVEPGRALVFSFNCPKDQQDRWQPQAKAIMKSVKMK